ncbi:MAG: MltA domain-containing protein [Burkholderiaceae bacterium]|nr:MltA domain-containing protein [Burkholderiaceae bacterium]
MARFDHGWCHSSLALVALFIAGCATAPLPPVSPQAPVAPRTDPPAAIPPSPAPQGPASAPAVPAPIPNATVPAAAGLDTRASYDRVTFDALPATSHADWAAAWPAFLKSCDALTRRDSWREVCAQTLAVDARDGAAVRAFFASRFDVYRIGSRQSENGKEIDARSSGLVTGYYEPLLRGSRARTDKFSVPLYRVPDDLIVVDLASVYPELSNMRLRGKLQGRRIVPYPTRGEIIGSNSLRGNELLWVDDSVDAFFLQIQGSGRVQLVDGTTVRVGYADQNGHPYRSLGRWLIDQGQLTIDQASMQGIKTWAQRNPAQLKEALDQNSSFVFFRELPLGNATAGPLGALGVALTPGRSVAVDPRFIPLGVPVVLATTDPESQTPIVRPMLAQDTGGAIRGPLRFDFFWGFGAAAGERAGRQKHEGRAWMLLPKGTTPEAMLPQR